jgi:hypothetical protein
MMQTTLAELLEQAVAKGCYQAFARTAEQIGEALAREILNEPAFREAMQELARVAFNRALADLGKDKDCA